MTKAKQGNNGFSATVQNLTEDQTSHDQPDPTSALLDMEEICRIPMEIALQNVGRQYSTEWGQLDPTVTDDMATSSGSAEEKKRLQTLKK